MAASVGTRPSRISPLMCRPYSRRTGIRLPKGSYNGNGLRSEPCPVNTLRGPCLEAAMGRTPGTDAGLVQRVLPATGVERTEGIHVFPSIDAGTMASQRVRFAQWEHRPDALPQLIRDTPGTAGF